MQYKIAEIATARDTGHTYVLVHFWRSGNTALPPDLTEEFLMQLRPGGAHTDLAAVIRANIERYWDTVAEPQKLSGDHTSDHKKPLWRDGEHVDQRSAGAIARDGTDPHRVLARPDVKALLDRRFERRQ